MLFAVLRNSKESVCVGKDYALFAQPFSYARRADKITYSDLKMYYFIQGDHSAFAKPPVDFKTKVPLWPGQARAGQVKVELLFRSQSEVLHKLNGHPVYQLMSK